MTDEKIRTQIEDYNSTIICSICEQEKPVEEGCFIAISINSDRCKSCQDKMQRQVKKLKGDELK